MPTLLLEKTNVAHRNIALRRVKIWDMGQVDSADTERVKLRFEVWGQAGPPEKAEAVVLAEQVSAPNRDSALLDLLFLLLQSGD